MHQVKRMRTAWRAPWRDEMKKNVRVTIITGYAACLRNVAKNRSPNVTLNDIGFDLIEKAHVIIR